MNFGFLIPTYVTTTESFIAFVNCINSLKKFHPNNSKILFSDPTNPYDISELDFIKNDPTIQVIKTRYCDGELNVLKHYYERKYFDIGIILHDSFEIKRELTNIETINDVNFIWYFTNHRVHWHIIEEEKTEYNIKNKIKTHDDLILHICKKSYEGTEFYKWLTDIYWKKEEWIGCFGPVSIINHSFLYKLQEKTEFLNIIPNIKDKRDRITIESIYALACQFVLGRPANSYDGLYYDGIHPNNGFQTDTFKKKIFYR